jgi:hypothetical protein
MEKKRERKRKRKRKRGREEERKSERERREKEGRKRERGKQGEKERKRKKGIITYYTIQYQQSSKNYFCQIPLLGRVVCTTSPAACLSNLQTRCIILRIDLSAPWFFSST